MACDTLSNVVRTTTKTIIMEFVHPMELSVCSPTSQSTISSQQDLQQDLPRKPSKIQSNGGQRGWTRIDNCAHIDADLVAAHMEVPFRFGIFLRLGYQRQQGYFFDEEETCKLQPLAATTKWVRSKGTLKSKSEIVKSRAGKN